MKHRISSKAMGKICLTASKENIPWKIMSKKLESSLIATKKKSTSMMIAKTLSDHLPYQSNGKSPGFESGVKPADSKNSISRLAQL